LQQIAIFVLLTPMIQVTNLSKAYGKQLLFDEVSFAIRPGERIGLVGRNGYGKTTLFRLIAREEEPDSGTVQIPSGYRIGYLIQHLQFTKGSVLEEVCQALSAREVEGDETYRAKAILRGLGFSNDELALGPSKLSGGFQVRLNLAKLLVSDPNLLLLDEPTNYLDIVSLRWLERFLRTWPRELMLITHDHAFMDRVTTHTMGIHRAKLKKLSGPTAKFYEQIRQEEEIYTQTRLNQERRIQASEDFINRFRAKASKASVVQSRIKALEKMQLLEKLSEISDLHLRFNAMPFSGKWLLEARELSYAYDPADKPLIDSLSFALGKGDRVAVIGKNGQGKTTLLRLLVQELQPPTGSVTQSTNLEFAYFGQTNVDRLNPDLTVEEEISSANPERSRTAVRNICGMMMFGGDLAEKKIRVLSGGERSRVLLGKILVSPANCLFLDEPTNHLDQESTDAFVEGLEEFPGAIVIVTHSEMILERLAKRLVVFDANQTFVFDGSYNDFLERVGWQEEEEFLAVGESESSVNKKELRRRRAEIIIRRSKTLSPFKERMAEIEDRIGELEKKVNDGNNKLIEASVNGFGEEEAKLSRNLCRYKNEIEQLFEELDKLSKEFDVYTKQFDNELATLDGALAN
jgi:ATP-binding cassette, subfamily F, member 3